MSTTETSWKVKTNSLDNTICFENLTFYSGSVEIDQGWGEGSRKKAQERFGAYWNIRGNRRWWWSWLQGKEPSGAGNPDSCALCAKRFHFKCQGQDLKWEAVSTSQIFPQLNCISCTLVVSQDAFCSHSLWLVFWHKIIYLIKIYYILAPWI